MRIVAVSAIVMVGACAAPMPAGDDAIDCRLCEDWNRPHAPVQIAEDTWYVGVHGLSSILIDTGSGLFLLDGGLPQSAPLIARNIESLGFALSDITYIGLSHAHYDHAGGLAALKRASGATVVARKPAAEALGSGGPLPDDPQYGERIGAFPSVHDVAVIDDGWRSPPATIRLTAIATPGHTSGGTSWQWTDCGDEDCFSVVYADSLTPISADGFRFSDGAGEILRRSAKRIAELDCDVLLAPHPGRFGLHDDDDDAAGREYSCASYAAQAIERLDRRLAGERQN